MAVGIESLCPLLKVRKQWVGRKKMILEPLFPSYVFVKVSPQEHSLLRLTSGVLNLVYWLGKPAVIKEEEITVIQRFIKDHESISLQKLPVNIHEGVRVIAGPLLNQEGEVMAVKKSAIKISLPSLGYLMTVELGTPNMEPVHPLPKNAVPHNLIRSGRLQRAMVARQTGFASRVLIKC